jgi:peptidyl-prolyl cis-trans isomerase B (cyclophilin B)
MVPRANNSTNKGGTVEDKSTFSAKKATIVTSKGNIVVELYSDVTPNTVTNFVTKAQSNFYNNLTFHRVEDWVIQGGDPKGDGTGGGEMATEISSKPFVIGSVGVARGGDINVSNDSQFFIVKNEASWLNSQYTNFGFVTSGMDVVNNIAIGDKILSIAVE